jgi:hypothetical protein
MKKQKEVTISEDVFNNEMWVGGFMGAYQLWSKIRDAPGNIRDNGDRLLRLWAQAALKSRHGLAGSPQELEAFLYCGLDPEDRSR